ncbi:hypothetical protein Ahy_B08g090531 [Arachis hypogaea]|uniref:Uncharacterized protein n=1 Tax=Arachis hypogaea TaxID=3818 RepID=A0A444Y080_ARAHY|nr:hypothetical protein Ahy_B08g090531 [Arachis hypogaea]
MLGLVASPFCHRRAAVLPPRSSKCCLAAVVLCRQAVALPLISSSPLPLVTSVVSSVTSELDAAATKLQKVYKSYHTRRNLANCVVVVEELWLVFHENMPFFVGVQFHSLIWRNKNLLCQGGQGQEQEQLRNNAVRILEQQLQNHISQYSETLWSFHGPRHWSISGSISSAKLITFKQMMMLMMMSFIKVIDQFFTWLQCNLGL